MVDLIEQCWLTCDELIEVTRYAAIQVVLQLPAAHVAGGSPQQGKRRGGVVFHGRQPGQMLLSDASSNWTGRDCGREGGERARKSRFPPVNVSVEVRRG